jgi:hypothetical protein
MQFMQYVQFLCIASEGDISQRPVLRIERKDTVLLCLWLYL